MAKAKHQYIDPETFEVYVEPGDELTPEIVEALGNIGAIRIRPRSDQAKLEEFGRRFSQTMFGSKPVRRFEDILPDWAK